MTPNPLLEYLCIEPYLGDALPARTLHAAFEAGLIDRLFTQSPVSESALFRQTPWDAAGRRFVADVLFRANILRREGDAIALTDAFAATKPFQDLMLTKLRFAELVAPDFFTRMTELLSDAERFMANSKLFELFDYGRCFDVTPENCLAARRWMNLTSTLTRYEAPVCHSFFDFAAHDRMLDLGGNSGEFAVQICLREPRLNVTVGDLPVVCHVGERHVAATSAASRIRFQPLSFVDDEFPRGHDLISFKSVLHDWPDDVATELIAKSFDALPPDGRLLIFERQALDFRVEPLSYGQLPVLLFFRSYRPSDFYVRALGDVGFTEIDGQTVTLDVPFVILSGRKPGE